LGLTRRCRLVFAVLMIFQALHSVEEYSTHLYDKLAPARFVSGLVSSDLRIGFAVFNLCVLALGALDPSSGVGRRMGLGGRRDR
jgi:hypothetical protein